MTRESRETTSEWIQGRHIVVANWRDLDHPQAGGAELYSFQVARVLAALGARVTVLTALTPAGGRHAVRDGVSVVRMGGRLSVYPLVLRWLWRNRSAVDGVLDCQNGIPFFSPCAVGTGVPVVLLIHHVHQEQFDYHLSPRMAWLGRFLEGSASRRIYGRSPVVAVSPSTRSEVRSRLRLKGPIYVVPNGVPPQTDLPRIARTPRPSIIIVGRLVPQKRLELLLEAVRNLAGRYDDLTVGVIGEGPQIERLRQRAKALGLEGRVTFHGRLPDEARDALLQSAWLTVNPSIREGWGLSVLEANRLGIPAVTFDVPGLRDAVKHGITGWVVRSGETLTSTLGDALDTLSDENSASQYSLRARDWATNFTWERTGERIAAVFASAAGRLGPSGVSRTGTDLVAKVHIEGDGIELLTRVASGTRAEDEWRVTGTTISGLMYGTDEEGAVRALDRLNVSPSEVGIAGSADLLSHGGPPAKRPRDVSVDRLGPNASPAPAKRRRDQHAIEAGRR